MDLRLLPGGPSRPVRKAAPVFSSPVFTVLHQREAACTTSKMGSIEPQRSAATEQGSGDGLQLQQRSFPPVFLLSVDGDNTSSRRRSSGDGRRLMVTNSSVQRSIGGSSLPCLRWPRNDQFNDEPER
nr:hypothetical protein Iba_chr08eCG5190 [Ipomoea batatas]